MSTSAARTERVDATRATTTARRAANLSLAVALGLSALKLAAAVATGSLAILSSLIDSLVDVAASSITWLSIRVAQRPPDRTHRYGHGKAEALSALVQGGLVAGSGSFVLVDGIRRLVTPTPVEQAELGLAAMLIAMAVTIGLILYQRHAVKVSGSQAIRADSLHYVSDLATNAAVIVSLALTGPLGLTRADPLIGIGIAGWLLWTAYGIGRAAVDTLMDHELEPADRARITATVRAHPEVHDMHDLRTRQAGSTRFVEFHLELDGSMSVEAAHDVTVAIEAELAQAFPDAEIVIHQEPAGLDDARLDHRLG